MVFRTSNKRSNRLTLRVDRVSRCASKPTNAFDAAHIEKIQVVEIAYRRYSSARMMAVASDEAKPRCISRSR